MIDEAAWPSIWKRHLDAYLQKPPRTGLWVDAQFRGKARKVLELGCGSGRDCLYLADRGFRPTATDLDGETLAELARRFPDRGVDFRPANAGELPFEDNAFELVFHNGLWVLFRDDETILNLYREQARVAARYAVILVHNALNVTLHRRFQRRAEKDELYDIRFFTPDEVVGLVERSGVPAKKIELRKFGSRLDSLYTRKRIKRVIPNVVWPARFWTVPRLYRLEPWSKVERIACVVEL